MAGHYAARRGGFRQVGVRPFDAAGAVQPDLHREGCWSQDRDLHWDPAPVHVRGVAGHDGEALPSRRCDLERHPALSGCLVLRLRRQRVRGSPRGRPLRGQGAHRLRQCEPHRLQQRDLPRVWQDSVWPALCVRHGALGEPRVPRARGHPHPAGQPLQPRVEEPPVGAHPPVQVPAAELHPEPHPDYERPPAAGRPPAQGRPRLADPSRPRRPNI
mmetsp:Transcript_10275/g.28887  ORF Transcript_10275/g.28887 Transcript_10275/m.28887 type:complete len:215 (+) Transcript_10275:1236-1880(+)